MERWGTPAGWCPDRTAGLGQQSVLRPGTWREQAAGAAGRRSLAALRQAGAHSDVPLPVRPTCRPPAALAAVCHSVSIPSSFFIPPLASPFLGLSVPVSHMKGLHHGFPGGSGGKEPTCSPGDPGVIPGSARSPGEGSGSPLQCSCLENSMDRGAWRAPAHGVTESDRTERLTHWTPSHQASSVPACVPEGSRWPYWRSSEDLGP